MPMNADLLLGIGFHEGLRKCFTNRLLRKGPWIPSAGAGAGAGHRAQGQAQGRRRRRAQEQGQAQGQAPEPEQGQGQAQEPGHGQGAGAGAWAAQGAGAGAGRRVDTERRGRVTDTSGRRDYRRPSIFRVRRLMSARIR